MSDRGAPLSVYLHVPFCTVKCAYCDFNSYANLEDEIPAWEAALVEELRLWAAASAGRPVPTVFFGGGTPSLLEGEAVQRLMDQVRTRWPLDADAEVTLEANPESVSAERLLKYRAAGVNRISMGVQSLQPEELVFLDRIHSAERAQEAFRLLRDAGFENVSVDLIFGLPQQSLGSWQDTVERVLGWGPDHVSAYALIVEEGTPLASRVARGEVRPADADVVASMSEWTELRLERAGYRQYEISNYAREGHECRHNLAYWRHAEYVGVGPGAHGFVNGVRYAVERSPMRYAQLLAPGRPGSKIATPAAVSHETVDADTAAVDTFVMGLRLNAGIDVDAFVREFPVQWSRWEAVVEWATGVELTERSRGWLRLTPKGRRLADELFVRVMEPTLIEDRPGRP